jgi:3-deoxy-D-manno-octulosonic-acid transferase
MKRLYNALWRTSTPFAKRWLARHPTHQVLNQRFLGHVDAAAPGAIWIQACSVGEVSTALPLLQALHDALPAIPLLLTASTATGLRHAEARCKDLCATGWFPFDHPATVHRCFESVRPRMLILVETELWPNVILEARRRGVPVLIVNGRIADKTFQRYQRFQRWLHPMLAAISAVAAQSPRHAERFIALGVPAHAVVNTGNLKFDGVRTVVDSRARTRLRAEMGIPADSPVLLFGSTRPGDEALASACWTTLREEQPQLRLLLAPRHMDRLAETIALFNEPVLLRSEQKAGKRLQGERVLILDTLGELNEFYALASVAVVGGSFYPGVHGHNPMEPAGLGVPTVFGPHMNNFLEAAEALVQQRGALQVACPEDLYAALSALLSDPAEQRQMGTRGRKTVLDRQGAVARTLDLIRHTLEGIAAG